MIDKYGERAGYIGVVTGDDEIIQSFPCIEGTFTMEVETSELKHGEGDPITHVTYKKRTGDCL